MNSPRVFLSALLLSFVAMPLTSLGCRSTPLSPSGTSSALPASGPAAARENADTAIVFDGNPGASDLTGAELTFDAYRGAFARDPALSAFRRDAVAAAARTAERLRGDAGIAFLPGRSPRIRLVDDADAAKRPGAAGVVEMRLLDGVRRPEIVLSAAGVASSSIRAKEDLPLLLVEAALLAAAKDRAPPDWLRSGMALYFGDALDRRVREIALTSDDLQLVPATFASLDDGFRAAALARIGQGERPFLRYVQARLAGRDDTTALREVGVEAPEFLDAATESDRERMLSDLRDDDAVETIRAVKARLAAGDVDGADKALGAARVVKDGASADAAAEIALLRAEIALRHGEAKSAAGLMDELFTRPTPPVRLRDARFLRALADANLSDVAGPGGRNIDVLRWHSDDPRAAQLAQALALPHGAVVASVFGSGSARAAAAERIGASAKEGAKAGVGAGSSAAGRYLVRMLKDGDPAVRRSVVVALAVANDRTTGADVAPLCDDGDPAVRSAALAALAILDPSNPRVKPVVVAKPPVAKPVAATPPAEKKPVDDKAPATTKPAPSVVPPPPKTPTNAPPSPTVGPPARPTVPTRPDLPPPLPPPIKK